MARQVLPSERDACAESCLLGVRAYVYMYTGKLYRVVSNSARSWWHMLITGSNSPILPLSMSGSISRSSG